MEESHGQSRLLGSEGTEQMEVYSDIKRADYTKEAGVYDQKRFLHEAGRFYADLSNQIIFDLLDA
ncbi:MAG: hypothetical protein HY282_12535, partial [Nitrospirae bacterium]|nr:hypothetical protein [Candidatus Manganitrophaceae bacterium]